MRLVSPAPRPSMRLSSKRQQGASGSWSLGSRVQEFNLVVIILSWQMDAARNDANMLLKHNPQKICTKFWFVSHKIGVM